MMTKHITVRSKNDLNDKLAKIERSYPISSMVNREMWIAYVTASYNQATDDGYLCMVHPNGFGVVFKKVSR